MTSNRPYRRGLSTERAVEELRESSGKQFDPELVDVVIDAAPALEEARRRSIETTNTLMDFPKVV
jgi:HD-GYP domain-containing protein (c-di-GMP phosphodiesterase class II)